MNEHDDFTTRLHRSLTDQSDTMAGAHLGLADVKGRARAIRRRRTATAVVGVAAAVGLLIPTVAMAGHTGGRPEPEIAPAVAHRWALPQRSDRHGAGRRVAAGGERAA